MNFSFNFWEWLWLGNIQDKQDQTNQLLEQIRRNTLTPAEREREDAQRVADAWAERVRREKNSRIGLAILGVILLVLLISWALPHLTDPNVLSIGFWLAVLGFGWWSVRFQARRLK